MDLFAIISILISLSAVFSFINYRWFRLPRSIGLMLFSLMLSLALIITGRFGWDMEQRAVAIVSHIDFNRLLLQGMLGFLLFAGALHVEANELMQHKRLIFSLATLGVVLSTFMAGALTWLVFQWLGPPLPFIYCLLFGALISPTDPVAVLAILREIRAPRAIETQMAGEALFNDGVGVVMFILLMRVSGGTSGGMVSEVFTLIGREVLAGVLLGLLMGWVAYEMLKRVDDYQVEIIITMGLAMGGYETAHAVGTSAPLAIVAAGLLIGNQGRALAMSEVTRRNLDMFWELVDEILNALLFILIGIEVLAVRPTWQAFLSGLVIIPMILLVRLVSVGIPFSLAAKASRSAARTVPILTWGGLRGGIAVALALSLPENPYRGTIVLITYMVVVFSIVVQGLTIRPLFRRWCL